ncbi:hydrogenase maturation protease [Oceanirhabdus sp. W0125-5]|uniref:hydrogenase maturation protease n=1 Tax=Oceanirhabdus sp. W0125-5 TaxID=2999116 RepID=UPI0022F31F4F|nr:hydrogenase maturation protease [Oceanirhabdus sp. W0125-5]WBW99054.1 hydrogenase maturation protease [Oceanirhabdus sp. W0125-5]
MKKKLFAIGNPIMMDDGIGIVVAEEIQDWLSERDIEVIIGETDADYCMSFIKKDDFILIIDATYLNIRPGCVTTCPIRELNNDYKSVYSQHEMSLLKGLTMYGKKVNGYFIGIEIEKIQFGCQLSENLSGELQSICEKVKGEIQKIFNESNN